VSRRFEGDYVRGGDRTLWMSRSDVVETLAMLRTEYPGQLAGILRESLLLSMKVRAEKRVERRVKP
jgi:hypothetical protein